MIPFNKPYVSGSELWNIAQAHASGQMAGDGGFTKKCQAWIQSTTGTPKALLTHSCTAALEMAAILLDVQPGDEIIMPSYTFVSTANAFVLRGGVPVFVDVRADTMNLDETKIEAAITKKTKAIVPVHYAGVACEMDALLAIARAHKIAVVEDAAQGVMSKYKGQSLGALGDMGAYSFHETKNVISGEGGAILVNDEAHVLRSEIIREKGTDRSRFFRGQVDKYTWQETGSSFLPGEIIAAFLWAQLEKADFITQQRLEIWNHYHQALNEHEQRGLLRRPMIPANCEHNAHMYYVLVPSEINRQKVLTFLKEKGIYAVFHYIPLHSSPGGLKYGRYLGDLAVTVKQSEQLIRLPLWIGLTLEQQNYIVDCLTQALAHATV
jgi:dTDP-4-amino-4,6-dideoxygalactose transaminase